MTDYKREFLTFMVRSGVLTFGEFTLKSGRTAPYFINTGNYRTGSQAARLGEFYAARMLDSDIGEVNALFGPAYKGIPLSVAMAIALANKHGRDVNYCFNRKEAKDHGEGGSVVGYQLRDGDRVVIVEDVITAGTAIRETLPLLASAAKVTVAGLIVSVDRMERGLGEKSALQEVYEQYGVKGYPIVTAQDILEGLYHVEIDGRIPLNDEMRNRMLAYLEQYGAK